MHLRVHIGRCRTNFLEDLSSLLALVMLGGVMIRTLCTCASHGSSGRARSGRGCTCLTVSSLSCTTVAVCSDAV
eukprot:707615-Amphidinium_carterae.1